MSTPDKRHEQTRQEGLSRIQWGESPESVSAWLKEQKFSQQEIDGVLEDGARERAKAVRAAGIDDLITGFLFILIFGGMFLVTFFTRARFALVDFTGLIGSAFGAYRMLRGGYHILEGGSYQGSITDLSRED